MGITQRYEAWYGVSLVNTMKTRNATQLTAYGTVYDNVHDRELMKTVLRRFAKKVHKSSLSDQSI